MKKLLLFNFLILILGSIKVLSQDTIRFEHLTNKEFFKSVKNNQTYDFYIDKDNVLYKKGDTLRLGKPEKQINLSGSINTPERFIPNFSFIRTHKEMIYSLEGKYANSEVIIEGFYVSHTKLIRSSPLSITIECRLGPNFPNMKNIFIDDIDIALEYGEVYNPRKRPSKKYAIQILEEKKKLLDLGLISKEEYDKIKNTYSDIILK